MTESTADPAGQTPADRRIAEAQQRIREESKALGRLATALGPLGKERTYADLGKLPQVLDKIEKKVASLPLVAERGLELVSSVRAELEERRRRLRESLASELRSACEARGLTLRVVSREDPVELRIPPFSVVIDRAKGQAEIRFARLPVATCAAEAEAILKAHEAAKRMLSADFDPERFFEACRKAWLAAKGSGEAGAGDRVEILDFLPHLALQLQKPSFRVEPSERNYRGYGRARFAWDVLRLRRESGLSRDGWRLNLGVATGTTASKKNRSLWFEDENGDGEFKLTVFFTRAES